MFSDHIGVRVSTSAGEALQVRTGMTGHAVYGPYEHVGPGRFLISFPIALADGGPGRSDEICARIDVASYFGSVILTAKDLRCSDLSSEIRFYTLELVNREFRSLEYRVAVTGIAALVVGHPQVSRLGDVLDAADEADPRQETDDPVELQRKVRSLLRPLRPQRAVSFNKVRLGNAGDGGYVCLDDFRAGDVALSLGINDDISWDSDAADRGLTIHQFDHTVDDPAPNDGRMHFNKKMIAARSGPNSTCLSDLIKEHDKGEARPNLFLKMDIEGHEWSALETTSAQEMSRFSQIVCELHRFGELANVGVRQLMFDGLSKILESHAVVHVHGNSCGGVANIANVCIPGTLEFTFVNRALYELQESDEIFPGPLDASCDAYRPDIFLGSFRF